MTHHAVAHASYETLEGLITRFDEICLELAGVERRYAAQLARLHPAQQDSGLNLLQYLQLRRHDLRPLQRALSSRGLSSLGRSEAHAWDNVLAVRAVLKQLARADHDAPVEPHRSTLHEAHAILDRQTEALLGPVPAGRRVRIMVTMPSEAASDYELVRNLARSGMDCMRINCAHDEPTAWAAMIENLRRAEAELGRKALVIMDLPGPKLRTGPIVPGPEVIKWRPQRNATGHVVAPARIWLTPAEAPEVPPKSADAILPIAGSVLALLEPGHELRLSDARDKQRTMLIDQAVGLSRWASSHETAYVVSGTALEFVGKHPPRHWPHESPRVGRLPAIEQPIVLHRGDTIIVTAAQTPGHPAERDSAGHLLRPATVPCSLPEVFADIKPGEAIWFDDGQIGGTVREVHCDPQQGHLRVEITYARPQGSKLRADKGINLPDSALRLPALTDDDREHIPFVAEHADLVGYSFVHAAEDVSELQDLLAKHTSDPPGIVLKIETRRAFDKLPVLLLAAMRSPKAGVMIARGDLAIECGYERLAEVQEEILWICEAARMPVIWATQVLETLAKSGLPSRAEVTDAAMGVRAECVMLNKGPYIVEALETLDDILRRMENHQKKKSTTLRPLRVATALD
jgi:pyruvate kinase